MKDETALICLRCEDGEPHAYSCVDRCEACGTAVWRGHSAPKVDHVMCVQCAFEKFKPGDKIEPPTEQQIDEIYEYFGKKKPPG